MSGVSGIYSPGMQLLGGLAQSQIAQIGLNQAYSQQQALINSYANAYPYDTLRGLMGGMQNAAQPPRPESEMDKRLRLLDEGIAEMERAWAPSLERMAERLSA